MSIRITLRQAIRLLCFFGDNDAEVNVRFHHEGALSNDSAETPSPAGLYAHNVDCPEQGADYLGQTSVDEDLKTAVCNVLMERQRQIAQEHWTPEHDDEHQGGDLAVAAASYALHAAATLAAAPDYAKQSARLWPWEGNSYKPRDPYRDLVRAAALLLAEAERMRRAGAPPDGQLATSDGERMIVAEGHDK